MAMFGSDWFEEDDIGPLSHWKEDFEYPEDSGPFHHWKDEKKEEEEKEDPFTFSFFSRWKRK